MNKKIAIIGSDSYIATHFYHILNDDVISLYSRNASGKDGEIVKDLFSIDQEDLKGADTLINFAAIVHQPEPKDDSELSKVNTELPVQLARLAKEAGVRHFVQMSSISVYGDVPTYEVDDKYNPEGFYGRTKMEADLALMQLQDDTFNVTLVRPPMVYGGGLSPGNMQKLVRWALKGIPFPVKGLQNQRDVIHVYNLVEALRLIIDSSLYGVLMPTDKHVISTEDIINLVDIFSKKKVRKIVLPKILKLVLQKVKPNLYHKFFGDSRVTCNMPETYLPKYKLKDGIEDIVRAIEES